MGQRSWVVVEPWVSRRSEAVGDPPSIDRGDVHSPTLYYSTPHLSPIASSAKYGRLYRIQSLRHPGFLLQILGFSSQLFDGSLNRH